MNAAAAIANLPKEDALTITDKAAVNEAVAMYNNLSSEEKALLSEETLVWLENAKRTLQDRIDAIVDISKKGKVANIPAKKVYAGRAFVPEPDVIVGGKYLKKGKDYTVTYKNNKNVGKATVTIKGINNYKGTITKTFKISPKKAVISKVFVGKKKMTVKIKYKVASTGGTKYQIAYKVKGAKKWNYTTTSKQSKVIKKLKKGKKYQVKVRAYKIVNKVKYTGAWTKIKTTSKIK